ELQLPEIPPDAEDDEKQVSQDFIGMAKDALDLLQQGVAECSDALKTIRRAALAGQWGEMHEGSKAYFDGVQKLYQINLVGESFKKFAKELFEELGVEPETEERPGPPEEKADLSTPSA